MSKSGAGCSSPLFVEWNQGARDYQEDYFGVYSLNGRTLLAVTDGMGGHSRGDLAARWVVEELIEAFKDDQNMDGFLGKAIKKVMTRMNDSGKDMGCTLVLGLLEKEEAQFKFSYTWIGDSRIYLDSDSRKPTDNAKTIVEKDGRTLWLLTDDDSFVWGFLLNRELTIDQLTLHPNKNQLEYSIHPRQEHVDEILHKRIRTCTLQPHDRLLLCSDGIWESYLMQAEIMEHLNDSNPRRAIAGHLKKALKEERFTDNGTYIIAQADDPVLKQQCLPGKRKRRFPGSFFFTLLALILFVAVFLVLMPKPEDQSKIPAEKSAQQQFHPVAPDPSGDQAPVKTTEKKAFFVIQVGSFPTFEEAKYYSERFRQLGYPVEISSPDPSGGGSGFQVTVGRFDSMTDAETEKIRLEKRENLKFTIKTRM